MHPRGSTQRLEKREAGSFIFIIVWTSGLTSCFIHRFVNPLGINKDFPPWAVFGTMVPALGLTFLGYRDQNLTSILINRKDHALRKPPAYHLDLFVCGAVVYPVSLF